MSDESFALSTVLPPLAAEGDYDAICATVMESARGRWFLQEYAKRNRNADTVQVLAAIERIERVIRGERGRDAYESFRGELAEMAKTIAAARAEVADIRPAAATGGTAPAKAADILTAAERLQDVTWTMRERGVDPATCDQIETITAAIQKATALRDPDDRRAQKLGEALQFLERRIHSMLEAVTSAQTAAEPTPEAAPPATMGAAVQAPMDDLATEVTPQPPSAPEEPAVEAHAVSAAVETGGLELEPLVVTPAALAVEERAPELEHAPLAVEPLFETPSAPSADRPDATTAREEATVETAHVVAAASADALSDLPGATDVAIEPAIPDDGVETPVHPPPPDFAALEPPPLAETMAAAAAAADSAVPSEAANRSTNIAVVEHAQSDDEFADEHALVVIERGVADEVAPAPQPDANSAVAAARESGDAVDCTRLDHATAATPAIAERPPADEQMRFDDWTKFAQELHAAGIKTQIPQDEPAPSGAAQATAADALAPEVTAWDPQPMPDGVAPNPDAPIAGQPFVGFPRAPVVLPEQGVKPPNERDMLVSAWEAAIARPVEEAIAPRPEPGDPSPATAPLPEAGPPAELAAFLLEPGPGPATPIEAATSAPANDEITELEAELFAPATPTAAEQTTPAAPQPAADPAVLAAPPAPAAASPAGATPPPVPQIAEARPPVRPAATPMPQPAPHDPLAALRAMSDEERIALFT